MLQERVSPDQNYMQALAVTGTLLASLLLWGCVADNPTSTDPVDDPTPTDPVNEPVPSDPPTVPSPPLPVAKEPAAPAIGWVSLAPRITLPTGLDAPPETGWPEPGQEVRWQVHVLNGRSDTLAGARYSWQIGGNTVESGEADLSPGETVMELARAWSTTREEIGFTFDVDTAAGIAVSDEITVISNALSVGLWIEQEIYDWMAQEPGVPPFELWARDEVERWNDILGRQLEPFNFDYAVIDRLRLDRVVVLPTGSPWPQDRDDDLVWYFSERNRFSSLRVGSLQGVEHQTVVLHELLHQRGLLDLYAYEVFHLRGNGSEIRILDPDGNEAAGSKRMYVRGTRAYSPNFDFTLMGVNYRKETKLSAHSAYGLNLFTGRRTPRWIDEFGNPENSLTEGGNPYLAHVPERIEFLLAPESGPAEPLRDVVALDVFLDRGEDDYQDVYLAEPDFTLEVDSSGIAVLPPGLWADTTWAKRLKPNVLILRARTMGNSTWGYAFLPVYDLNFAFIRGARKKARFTVRIRLQ